MKHELVEKLLKLETIFTEGFTVRLDPSGDIVQPFLTKGYLVSYKTLIIIDYNKRTRTTMLTKHLNSLELKPEMYIGGWYDSDSKQYFIECNYHIVNNNIALRIARELNQECIYDVKNQRCIKV